MSNHLEFIETDRKIFLWLTEADRLKIPTSVELRRVADEIDKCSAELPYYISLLLRQVTEGEYEVTAPKTTHGKGPTWSRKGFEDFMDRVREDLTRAKAEDAEEAKEDPEWHARMEPSLQATYARVERLLLSTPYDIFLFRQHILKAVQEEVESILRDLLDETGPFERQLQRAAEEASDAFLVQWKKGVQS